MCTFFTVYKNLQDITYVGISVCNFLPAAILSCMNDSPSYRVALRVHIYLQWYVTYICTTYTELTIIVIDVWYLYNIGKRRCRGKNHRCLGEPLCRALSKPLFRRLCILVYIYDCIGTWWPRSSLTFTTIRKCGSRRVSRMIDQCIHI